MTQAQALAILKTGTNVFLTGEPGSGKTYTVNSYVAYLRERGIAVAITASTGIAATHIGGMTIHSWSAIGIKTKLDKRDLADIAANEYAAERVGGAKVLILDEVSMLTAETLAMVDAVCREVRGNLQPFGGLQVVLVGDFFQLPPVVKCEDVTSGTQAALLQAVGPRFAYHSAAWQQMNPTVCYLMEQFRQDDAEFLEVLSAIRGSTLASHHLERIATRVVGYAAAPVGVPKLFSHNEDVDRMNNELLGELPDEAHEFSMSAQGPKAMVAALTKGCLSPETLRLKVGASVMFTKNSPRGWFVNGTLGSILGFAEETGRPIVKLQSGRQLTVEPMDWTMEEGGKVRARITQLPLRLAWAITVHKSQGMSLDSAVVDLRRVFEFGQGYVALSRVRRLAGLHVLGWNERTFQVHPEVTVQDVAFRSASREAEAGLAQTSTAELKQRQADFVLACGGKLKPLRQKTKKVGQGVGLEQLRQAHPNAYRPWDAAQDEALRTEFAAGTPVAKIAKALGRKRGAITMRLAKLELGED